MTEADVEITRRGDLVVASIEGEIDFTNAQELSQLIRNGVSNDAVGLAIDLTAVRYIDSAGVRILFEIAASLEATRLGAGLVLAEGASVRRLVQVTHLDEVAPLFSSVEECAEALSRAAKDRI